MEVFASSLAVGDDISIGEVKDVIIWSLSSNSSSSSSSGMRVKWVERGFFCRVIILFGDVTVR